MWRLGELHAPYILWSTHSPAWSNWGDAPEIFLKKSHVHNRWLIGIILPRSIFPQSTEQNASFPHKASQPLYVGHCKHNHLLSRNLSVLCLVSACCCSGTMLEIYSILRSTSSLFHRQASIILKIDPACQACFPCCLCYSFFPSSSFSASVKSVMTAGQNSLWVLTYFSIDNDTQSTINKAQYRLISSRSIANSRTASYILFKKTLQHFWKKDNVSVKLQRQSFVWAQSIPLLIGFPSFHWEVLK